ncbi:MAG: hypothetical protein V7646_2819, partial [Pseudonocardia sp.]
YGNKIENNLVYDTMNYPGIMLATDHDPLPFSGTTPDRQRRALPLRWRLLERGSGVRSHHALPPGQGHPGRHYPGHRYLRLDVRRHPVQDGRRHMPDVAITNVKIDKSNNGAGILAMSGARGNAILSNVTITNSADDNIVTQPGSTFTIAGQ